MGGNDWVWVGPNGWPVIGWTLVMCAVGWWMYRSEKNLPVVPPWIFFWQRQSFRTGALPPVEYTPEVMNDVLWLGNPVTPEAGTLTLIAPFRSWWPGVVTHDAHIMLVGETRSGKSTTARALLAARARTDKIVVIDPHMKFNDWGSVAVIGDGRDFAAITQAFLALHKEFERRFKVGEAVGSPLTVFIDEFPAISAARPQLTGYLTQWLRESAKANMRLVLLVQDPNVKTLGIEGEGAVRENLLKILLGSFATKQGATGRYPAVLDRRGEVTLVSTDGMTTYAQMAVSALATWPIEITKDDEVQSGNTERFQQLLKVARMLGENPEISQREIAQRLWPDKSSGGRAAMKAKALLDEVQTLLRVPPDAYESVPPGRNATEQQAEHLPVEHLA